ncbi:DUF6397 family protein [Streptomyces sp. LMG1-1-1.1]|uniref:DUF6397 family protein n=1 Tax=Streptomyces sp. LMG1-1-1.1 TaxID=3135245 RepID=UPI003467BD18
MTVDEGTRTVTPARAAQELELRRDEFRLAVQLGLVRTVPTGEGGRRRVERGELDRLRGAPDFPAGLRDRVRTVGTGEAAALLSITPERFTRLARTGHLSPVRFTLNRYRAVVWTYLAEEVTDFGHRWPALLAGRLPLDLRERLAAHEDRRPRNWRARRIGLLLRATDDPWARAAAIASLLDPVQLAEVVDDPYERAHLDRLRPPPPSGMPVAAAAHDVAERLTRAAEPDEILWHRMSLALALDEARARRSAPYPGEVPSASDAVIGVTATAIAATAVTPGRAVIPAPAAASATALTPGTTLTSVTSSTPVTTSTPVTALTPIGSWTSASAQAPAPAPAQAPAQAPAPAPAQAPAPASGSALSSASTESGARVAASADGWTGALTPGLMVRRVRRADPGDATGILSMPPLPPAPPGVAPQAPRHGALPEPISPVPPVPAVRDRPPGRPARAGLLDRLRRRRGTGGGRTRRGRRSVNWP